MKQSLIKEFLLYRYRYIIGYVLYSLLLVALLTLSVTDIPRGLSFSEMSTATQSATTSITSLLFKSAVDAPYMLLQKASLHFFGVTTFAIRLPSIILALMTGIALALMLRRWFRVNVAVLSGILAATSAPFLVMGRSGTSLIMTAFWLSIILLAATKMLHNKRHIYFWKLTCFVSAAMSLYTPLMIYPLLAIGIAGLLHPHVRFILRKVSLKRFAVALLLSGMVLAPLVWSITHSPATLKLFLGLPPTFPGWDKILSNSSELGLAFYSFSNIGVGEIITPLFGAATIALILLGLLKSLVDRFSARSYMLILWIIFITPIALLNPKVILIYFMPATLLLSIGIETMIREWYRLFPRNPYARIAALIPLTILLVSISASNVSRYYHGYLYSPEPGIFSQELDATRNSLAKAVLKNKSVDIVTTPETASFYDLLRREYKNVSISTIPKPAQTTIISEKRFQQMTNSQQQSLKIPYRLVTSGASKNSLLVRVYVSK